MSSRNKRPGLNDVANAIARSINKDEPGEEAPTVEPAPGPPAAVESTRLHANNEEADEEGEETVPAWRKFTVPFRTEQLKRLERLLAKWSTERQIKISAAEVLRLGLDTMLERMVDEPDEVLVMLFEQEQHEQAAIPTRKFGRSRGLGQYLRRKKLL